MKKLLLLCLLLGVSIGAFAQVDTLSPITPPLRRSPFVRDMERITSSRAYRITYIGVPLIVAGLVVQERDRGFRHLRNDYVPSFRLHYDDYLQYAPAALMLGLKIGGVRGRSSWGRMLVSDAFSVALMAGAVNSLKYYLPYAPPRRIEQQVVSVGGITARLLWQLRCFIRSTGLAVPGTVSPAIRWLR